MPGRKDCTPCVTAAAAAASLRRDTIAAWRPLASSTILLRWSARHRPKVTNQVCSRPGWYGSLMFSCISFQLAGMRWRFTPSSFSGRSGENTRST